MHGPTLAMSLVDTPVFPRSHSSTNIPDLAKIDYKRTATHKSEELPRSASFTCMPTLAGDLEFGTEKQLHRISSQSLTTFPSLESTKSNGTVKRDGKPNKLSKERVEKDKVDREKAERVGRRKSLVARPKSWIQRVKGGSPERQSSPELANTTPSNAPPVPPISKATRDKTKTVSESFATFARKSWINSSRSPSPNRNLKDLSQDGKSDTSLVTASPLSTSTASTTTTSTGKLESASEVVKPTGSPPKGQPQTPPRTSSTLQKMRQRPQSVLMNFTTFNSANSSTSSLPRSSVDNRSTPRTSTDRVPPIPKAFSTEKLLGNDRRKDELWSAFRSLDNDFSKFQSKSWSLKTNVIRSSLLPFLRNHASHPSNKTLRPEDVDRRVMTLNKWWNGLLEVLDGRQNQTVSGVDRPVLLEATLGIMTRPEWRLGPSRFAPLSERSPNRSPERRSIATKKSTSSLNSSGSQFLAESVFHNVRNLFIQNLLTQMSLVVSKMSLRHAPASLVTFCGKATAYAFFFVPGVADILVRIWKLQAETLRRVADEFGLSRRPNKLDADEVVAKFPAHTHSLGWTSAKAMANQLRQTPLLPIVASQIPWFGPWVARWCGRDSDLFFVFAKHYHILAEEFMPADLSFVAKARAPGFVLVHAQLLSTLDATIHRQPAGEPLPVTFDDVLAGADASAAALPLPSNNSARLMAENRLIMLLRDFISERVADFQPARTTFAEAFGKIMQASARRTSLFDHNACFVLCDFMEEALTLFVRFHHAYGLEQDYIDWMFWLEVCKKMLESQNSMSEIRLFAFLFGAWNVVTNDPQRKEIICLDWLLTEDTFGKFFNHWCPMVRAYYMRLLCWRLCREDGEASELDTKIFCLISTRIKANWAHYLFVKQVAEKSRILPPSTAPCYPAPGRRLLIIRNDNQSPASNLFLGFDGVMSSSSSASSISPPAKPTASKRQSFAGLTKLDTTENTPKLTSDTPTTPSKKRWTFMGKILPSTFNTSPDATPPSSANSSRNTSPTNALEEARKETALARSRPELPKAPSSSDSDTLPQQTTHRAYCFKFSLEWTQNFEKAQNALQNGLGNSSASRFSQGLNVGHERRLNPPRLPAPAQAWVGSRVPGMSKEISAQDPSIGEGGLDRVMRAKYAGRALAEWALVVGECNNFVDRRRAEGVPALKWVEVPTLGIEGFRKFGAG